MSDCRFRLLRLFLCAVLVADLAACQQAKSAPAVPAAGANDAAAKELAAMKADIQILKDKAPSASVAMADVSFHWSNLWFAGQARNWPLANYYYSEARNHVRWLIRINPMPKGPDGKPVDLKGIFDAIDTSTFAAVKAAIDKKDSAVSCRLQSGARIVLLVSQIGRQAVPASADSKGGATDDRQSRPDSHLAAVV